jgi:molybdopterin/thiamine biosynthesis adenylyltransferase
MDRFDQIGYALEQIDGVDILTPFEPEELRLKGNIKISVEDVQLDFAIEIFHCYPLSFQGQEAIRFINKDLISFNHVNRDGSVCLHTLHSPDITQKIAYDIDSLKQWIRKYYIKKDIDNHYEHIIVPVDSGTESEVFLFTDVDYSFTGDDFGTFTYSTISSNILNVKPQQVVHSNIVVDYRIKTKKVATCKWDAGFIDIYAKRQSEGLFLFLKEPPVEMSRFAVSDWLALDRFLPYSFKEYLHEIQRAWNGKNEAFLPLLLGYRIDDVNIHWQSLRIDMAKSPIKAERIPKTRVWNYFAVPQLIKWQQTDNCSYDLFFGRGKMNDRLAKAKIGVLGVGAVGSNLAKTLVRGGATNVAIVDHDMKEAGNICRSEYAFGTGVNKKIHELLMTLRSISPFVRLNFSEGLIDTAKFGISNGEWAGYLCETLSDFDVIFDCTTDNDVAFMLNNLPIKADIFSISITNHARELVCALNPNLYGATNAIYALLNNDVEDLYNPTGCWSPTFKASYNDISVLVQYALKQINLNYERNVKQRSFYLSTDSKNGFKIKLQQL